LPFARSRGAATGGRPHERSAPPSRRCRARARFGPECCCRQEKGPVGRTSIDVTRICASPRRRRAECARGHGRGQQPAAPAGGARTYRSTSPSTNPARPAAPSQPPARRPRASAARSASPSNRAPARRASLADPVSATHPGYPRPSTAQGHGLNSRCRSGDGAGAMEPSAVTTSAGQPSDQPLPSDGHLRTGLAGRRLGKLGGHLVRSLSPR
jgi:hypothetical protein